MCAACAYVFRAKCSLYYRGIDLVLEIVNCQQQKQQQQQQRKKKRKKNTDWSISMRIETWAIKLFQAHRQKSAEVERKKIHLRIRRRRRRRPIDRSIVIVIRDKAHYFYWSNKRRTERSLSIGTVGWYHAKLQDYGATYLYWLIVVCRSSFIHEINLQIIATSNCRNDSHFHTYGVFCTALRLTQIILQQNVHVSIEFQGKSPAIVWGSRKHTHTFDSLHMPNGHLTRIRIYAKKEKYWQRRTRKKNNNIFRPGAQSLFHFILARACAIMWRIKKAKLLHFFLLLFVSILAGAHDESNYFRIGNHLFSFHFVHQFHFDIRNKK